MGLWNWRNKAIVDLPMGHAEHDPVNTRTLNRGRGGAGLDAVFGAGVASPTKRPDRHGYLYDGGDWMTITADPAIVPGTHSVLLAGDFELINGNTIFDANTGGGAGWAIIAGTLLSSATGTHYVNGQQTSQMHPGNRTIAITAMALDIDTVLTLGADTGGANAMTGGLDYFAIFAGTLSPLQVQDFHIASLRQWHRI